MEVIKITSSYNLIFSESDPNSDTVDGKFIICDFDPNKNDVALNRDRIDEWKDTLMIKPLVGKVITLRNGKKDFSGHNVKVVERIDENGDKYQAVEFDTSAFGSFYSVGIETIDNVDCIVANAKIWKRFSQAYEVIKNRAESANGIKTSWEIQVLESHFENRDGKQIKVIDKGIFIGHALLGESAEPAYDSSGLLSVASQYEITDIELDEALVNDIIEISQKEEEQLDKTLTSALTTRDLHQKVREALNPKGWNSNPYYSVWEIYPTDSKVLAYDIDRDSEDNYLVFTFTVENDTVSIGESKEAKLSTLISERTKVNINIDLNETAQLLSTKEQEIASLKLDKETIENQLNEKVEALVSANTKIQELEISVQELTPFKEQVEEAQRVERERDLAEKRIELKEFAMKSKQFTDEELETSEEIKGYIENLDETKIKVLISERFMKQLEVTNAPRDVSKEKDLEVSSTLKKNINEDENVYDYKVVMNTFFKN